MWPWGGVGGGGDLHTLVPMILLNGASYFTYNVVSFVVLDRVHVVTHAVANAVRRVVTIFASVLYFRNVVTSTNALGVMLAVVGVMLYSVGAATARTTTGTPAAAAAAARRGGVPLLDRL